jgi:hypothetical protein
MKLGELLELTLSMPLAKIAKERLTIGEHKAKDVLKEAGCYSISGKRGWYLKEGTDKSILEKSIYDFPSAQKKVNRKPKATGVKTGSKTGIKNSPKTGTGTTAGTVTGINDANIQAFNEVATGLKAGKDTGAGKGAGAVTSISKGNRAGNETGKQTDILDRLFTGISATTDKKEVSFYLTHDVIEVINRAKKGNRSDLVNEALRKVFKEKGWLK